MFVRRWLFDGIHCYLVISIDDHLFDLQLPSFFVKSHDYTMYTNDIEFVNCILNAKTR